MTPQEPLVDRAREAFAAYRGLGREILDEMIFALTRANTEVERLRASREALLATAKEFANEQTMEHLADLNLAIAKAEEFAP
jgi:hypothetical protein